MDDDLEWNLTHVDASTDGVDSQKWGDYLGIRANPNEADSWISTGFCLKNGSLPSNVSVHTAEFSKENQSRSSNGSTTMALIQKAENKIELLSDELEELRTILKQLKQDSGND